MEQVNLGSVIEQAITKFTRNRIGDKPPVFVVLSPALTRVPWKDRTLGEFLQFFLYESLLTSHPDTAIEISLRRRLLLKDLTAFVGVQPSYWVQIRVSGRGLRIAEPLIALAATCSIDLSVQVGAGGRGPSWSRAGRGRSRRD